MSQQLEVILTDRAGGQQPMASPQQSNAPSYAERAPGPADRQPVTGPRRSTAEKTASAAGHAVKAADILSQALGAGGVFAVSKQLAESFLAIFRAVNKATDAHQANARAVDSATNSVRRGETVTGPRKAAAPEVIDAEFEVKGPKPGLVPTGPRRNEGGLIKAPQELSTKHATTRVDTVGIKGPKDVPVNAEIVGPSAAGSKLATLAAAAGPAAVAVATLTAAAVAGGVAIKKIAEGLDSEAHRLAKFSPQLAGATATNDIRLLFADLRRANQVGPQLARFENRFGRGQEALMDLQTQMLKVLLEIEEELAPLIEAAIATAKTTAEHVPQIAQFVLQTAKIANPKLGLILDAITIISRIAKKWAPKEPDPPMVDPFMQAFLAHFDGRDPIAAVRAAAGKDVP